MYTSGEIFSVKIKNKEGWACKKYRNKQGRENKKTTLLQKNYGEERLEDYITSDA